MKATKGKVTLSLETYAYPRRTRQFAIDAYLAGEVAIHRPHFWDGNESGDLSHLSDRWTVSHVPSGLCMARALPPSFSDRGAIVATKRDLQAWAGRVQEDCPEWFERCRTEAGRQWLRTESGWHVTKSALEIMRKRESHNA